MKNSGPDYITIGKVLGIWGNKGKLKVKMLTDFPDRFKPSSEVLIGREPAIIESEDWRKGALIVKIKAIDTMDQARVLIGQTIEIHKSRLQTLPDGQYYFFQVIGLTVYSTNGDMLGRVVDVYPAEGSDIYVIRGERRDILVPAIEDIVTTIDIDGGKMTIEPIDGLLDLNNEKGTF